MPPKFPKPPRYQDTYIPEGYFYTGGGGPTQGHNYGSYGGGGYGISPAEIAAMHDAAGQSEGAFQQGQGRLAPGQFANSQLGLIAGGRYANSYGFKPEVLQAMKLRAQQVNAGAMGNAMESAKYTANANGGLDSAGMSDLESRIRMGGASDLNNAWLDIDTQDAAMGLDREKSSAAILAEILGLESSQNMASAQGYFDRQYPILPGSDGGPGGSQFSMLDEHGRPTGFNPDGSTWNDAQWAEARRQQEIFAQQFPALYG
jgi:hypothetical protein